MFCQLATVSNTATNAFTIPRWIRRNFHWTFTEDTTEAVFVKIADITRRASTATSANPSFIAHTISIGMKPMFVTVSILQFTINNVKQKISKIALLIPKSEFRYHLKEVF